MKAILLVRVSSDSQEFEEQKRSLYQYAEKVGYTENDLILVENEESAMKLKIEEREGIIETKEYIEKDKAINAVFVWELSRLVRNQTEGHILKDYFFKHKIQFYCSTPEIRLFNDDVSAPHETGDIAFSLFLQIVENEMRTKKARFHRSKIRNARMGKYSGGFIKYGYYVDENGIYQIKESEAEMIRYIFDEYEKGRSTMNIQRELLQRGLINSTHFVRGILTSQAYTGVSDEYGMSRTYPQIISKEQFEKCRELAKTNNKRADKANEIYYAKKLIKCVECGTHYIAMKSSLQYLCYGRYGKEAKLKPETACKSSPTININVLDSLLWYLAKPAEAFRLESPDHEEKEVLEKEIIECKKQISESEKSKKAISSKKERITDSYLEGIIDKSKRDIKLREINKLWNETNNFIIKKRNEIRKAEGILKTTFEIDFFSDEYMENAKNEIIRKRDAFLLMDDNEKYEIIKRNIPEVNIHEGEKNKTKIVEVRFYNDKVERYRINIKKKPVVIESDVLFNTDEFEDWDEEENRKFHEEYDENPYEPISLEITQRFVRKSRSNK
jgi:DNA invertase Pin-like site-specific DNA recombinase